MHFWPTAIRLLMVSNVLGTVGDARRAWFTGQRLALHWLVPKAAGWAALLWAVIPSRWSGPQSAHWEAVLLGGLGLVFYGVLIEMTDPSHPPLPWITFESPHFGPVGPVHMVLLPAFGLALTAWDVLRHGRVTRPDALALGVSAFALVIGVRFLMRVAAVKSLSELLALVRPRGQARPTRRAGQKYYMGSGEE